MKCIISRMKRVGAWGSLAMILVAGGLLIKNSVKAITEADLYFYSQNNILYVDYTCSATRSSSSGSIVVNGDSMEEKIWSALRSFMSEEQAAGAMGNLRQEGNMNPVLHEGAFANSGRDIFTDTQVSYGVGLVQWSFGRRTGMLQHVLSANPGLKQYFTGHSYNKNNTGGALFLKQLADEIGETQANQVANELISLEIEYVQKEMNNSRAMHLTNLDWSEYFKITDLEEATMYWFSKIENPGDSTGPKRLEYAREYYEQFTGKTISSSSTGNGGNGGCTRLTSSPDYSSDAYQTKLSNLNNFSQMEGHFKSHAMKNGSGTISASGCGIMSVYAAYYMFSGAGMNDDAFFEGYLNATIADGYNSGTEGSTADNYGEKMTDYLQMTYSVLFNGGSYSGAGDQWNAMVAELNKGHKVMINVAKDNGSLFAGTTHFMLLDHYDATKDMVYMFDPAASWKESQLSGYLRSGYLEYYKGDRNDGIYVSRAAMNDIVRPRKGMTLAYNGCYDGGMSGTNVCGSRSGGLVSGGMTYDEAVEFMKPYREEASKLLVIDYGAGRAGGTVIGEGYVHGVSGTECTPGGLNNCVAFSQWFVNNYTTAGDVMGLGNGRDAVGNLLRVDGFETYGDGMTPVAYAVFSEQGGTFGHTGVVLGIDEANNEIYIGEAGCTAGFSATWPGVHKNKLSDWTGTKYTYAYPRTILKM